MQFVTKNGIFYKKAHTLKWDSQANDAHDIVLERTVRGLYYYHFNNDILGSRAKVRIHWYYNLTKEMYKIAEPHGKAAQEIKYVYM